MIFNGFTHSFEYSGASSLGWRKSVYMLVCCCSSSGTKMDASETDDLQHYLLSVRAEDIQNISVNKYLQQLIIKLKKSFQNNSLTS